MHWLLMDRLLENDLKKRLNWRCKNSFVLVHRQSVQGIRALDGLIGKHLNAF